MRKIFKVTPEDRELYSFKVPKKYVRDNRLNDCVSYRTGSTSKGAKPTVWAGATCYSSLRPNLSSHHITCIPYARAKDSIIDLGEAIDFFQIMAKHGILPEKGIELREEENETWGKGVVCEIPAGQPKSQQVYATLTCYRWLDAHPMLVWEFLKIYRCGLDLSAFQILPYLIAKYVYNCNHSFINSKSAASLYEGGTPSYNKNSVAGVAARVFFDKADKRGISFHNIRSLDDGSAPVNTAISQIATEITPVEPNPDPKNRAEQLVYEVSEPEDTLHPKFKPLYEIPNITKEQVIEILEQLFTEGK